MKRTAEPVLSTRALNRATMARQMLLRREKVAPVTAVERLVAMQAQLARPPFVGLWSRLAGFTRATAAGPIARRDLVRATMMRGTIHLLSRRDFLAFRSVMAPVLARGMESVLRDRTKGFDLDRVVAAARQCFGEKPRTFAELRTHLAGLFPKADERAMGYTVRMYLPLVLTPDDEAQWAYSGAADFAVADAWLGEPLATDEAPHALVLRYFAAYGPASVQDFQSWSGLTAAREVVDALRPKLLVFRDDRGRELFDVPDAPRPDEDVDVPVRFLPEFDSVLLGYADRTRVMDAAHKPHIFTKNLLVPATFIVDGRIAGMWNIEFVKRQQTAMMVVRSFAALGRDAKKALGAEADALIGFLEPDAKHRTVTFDRVT
jgi:hypothetical protein